MENAILELEQEHNGGVLIWFLELLWTRSRKQDLHDDSLIPTPPYMSDFPAIPHSVVFNYSHAQGWFFEPSHAKGKDARRIRRKRRQHLVAHVIFEELAQSVCGKHGGPANEVVAQLITRQSLRSGLPKIVYFTRSDLEQLLFRGTIAEGSILQKFVVPQGPSADLLANHNVVFHVIWETSYCYVERLTNHYTLSDESKTAAERCATVEDTRHAHSTALKHNAAILHRCRKACNAMVTHVAEISGLHIRSLVCFMKISAIDGRLHLLYINRVSLIENSRLTPNLPRGGADVSTDEEDEDLPIADREWKKEWNRCTSPSKRERLKSLIPESLADKRFDALAPRSWTLQGRHAYRFAAIPSRSRASRNSRVGSAPLSRGASGKNISAVTPEAQGESFSHDSESGTPTAQPHGAPAGDQGGGGSAAAFALESKATLMRRSSFSIRRSMTTALREAEVDVRTRTEAATRVTSETWNAVHERVEVALMRDATIDLYPMKRVAHSVAGLGLREKYIAAMQAASLSTSGIRGW